MKSSQQRYNEGNHRKVRNAPQSFTNGKYFYLDHPPMTTSHVKLLATKSFNKWTPPKGRPFKIIKGLLKIFTIGEDENRSTVSIPVKRGKMEPLTRIVEQKIVYTSNEPVFNVGEKVKEAQGQSTAEELADAKQKYAVDLIVRHVGEDDEVLYIMGWSGYKLPDSTAEPPHHIPEQFITRYW